ncbi:MAG: carboxypeptidase M32, partial [Verrucomicrobiota bacterium]
MDSAAYQNLLSLSEHQRLVGDAQALLSWDQEVLLPPAGVEYRGKQMSWFSGWLHEEATRPEVGDWISEAESLVGEEEGPEAEAVKANLREWRRNYDRETKLPKRLVEDLARVQTESKSAWAEARKVADFSKFAPHLETLISLCREQAACWGFEGDRTYDGLIDKFEPGADSARLSEILGELRENLVPIVSEATARETFDESRLEGHYPIEQQEAFNREVAEAIGFDFESGRIDTAVHPFCSGMAPHDVR